MRSAVDRLRGAVVTSTVGLFSHGPDPLEHTLSHRGDPGLFGPGSVTWRVLGDPASFVGGIRAMLLQAALPEVAAGVSDHSRYRQDPLGRLSRTSAYMTATADGATPEVDEAVRVVNAAHRGVAGRSHRGRPYAAAAPALAAWVHNTLVDSFLVAYQHYGPRPLTGVEADRYVAEQRAVGRLLRAEPLPGTAADLRRWVRGHPGLAPSPGQREAGRVVTRGLRWTLGPSPAWLLALARVGEPAPDEPGLGLRAGPRADTVAP